MKKDYYIIDSATLIVLEQRRACDDIPKYFNREKHFLVISASPLIVSRPRISEMALWPHLREEAEMTALMEGRPLDAPLPEGFGKQKSELPQKFWELVLQRRYTAAREYFNFESDTSCDFSFCAFVPCDTTLAKKSRADNVIDFASWRASR